MAIGFGIQALVSDASETWTFWPKPKLPNTLPHNPSAKFTRTKKQIREAEIATIVANLIFEMSVRRRLGLVNVSACNGLLVSTDGIAGRAPRLQMRSRGSWTPLRSI